MKTVNLTEEEHAELLALRSKKTTKASAPATSDVVRAAGTSEGAKKGWEHRDKASQAEAEGFELSQNGRVNAAAEKANIASHHAKNASEHARKELSADAHDSAGAAHKSAASAHNWAAIAHDEAGNEDSYKKHSKLRNEHFAKAKQHFNYADLANDDPPLSGSDAATSEVIHCRSHASAAGSVLAAEKAWNAGEPVEFMWMPAGRHTICAGFRNGSIELTVNCDENTAANVQASLDAWRTERPKQEPFGCVEHREHEASVRVSAQQAFSFKDDGVYIAAEPTALGAQNVNGKVHRSWSPSFTTDADYSAAKTVKTASGATVMVFPEGVRGSRSNPAEITGVDFCVGTLTNKPAFHAMSPVKSSEGHFTFEDGTLNGVPTWHPGSGMTAEKLAAKRAEPVQASGTSEGAKKGWEDRGYGQAASKFMESGVENLHRELNQAKMHYGYRLKDHNGDHYKAAAETAYNIGAHKATAAAEMHGQKLTVETKGHATTGYRSEVKEGGKLVHTFSTRAGHESGEKNSWSKAKASDSNEGDQVHAHCAHILLQDVPDATAAEIACYDKCIDGGGSHVTAVTEIKSQRKPEHVTQKASEDLTPDSIYAALEQRTAAANAVATEAGVLSAEDVYEKVTATWSSQARAAAAAARKNHSQLRPWEKHEGFMSDINKLADEKTSEMSRERLPGGDFHKAKFSDHVSDGSYSHHQHIVDTVSELAEKHKIDIDNDDDQMDGPSTHVVEKVRKNLKMRASESSTSDPIHATWSDAARQAAAASRKSSKAAGFHQKEAESLKPGGEVPFATGKLAHEASSRAFQSGDKRDHKEAMELHDKAATAARNVGNDNLADQHVEHIHTHRKHADLVNKASEGEITLESIYARAGANR